MRETLWSSQIIDARVRDRHAAKIWTTSTSADSLARRAPHLPKLVTIAEHLQHVLILGLVSLLMMMMMTMGQPEVLRVPISLWMPGYWTRCRMSTIGGLGVAEDGWRRRGGREKGYHDFM